MKTRQARLVFIAAFAAIATITPCVAQTIDFLFITKQVNYTQTSASTPSSPDSSAYQFYASIDGTGLNGSNPTPPNTVTTPGGTVSSVTLALSGSTWQTSDYSGYADPAALNAAFADGTYVFSINNGANTVNLSLASDLYPNAPGATISTNTGLGFAWVGSALQVNPTLFSTLTVTTNAFTTNFDSGGLNHIGISGNNFSGSVSGESFSDVDGVFALNISSASFLAGNTYSIDIEFNNLITYLTDTPLAGITSTSGFTAQTSFSVQAVPEPSTYAAILGALALTGSMIYRRRRAA